METRSFFMQPVRQTIAGTQRCDGCSDDTRIIFRSVAPLFDETPAFAQNGLMAALSIHDIRQRILNHEPGRHSIQKHTRQAAVSIVLKNDGPGITALFILRAKKDGDPWSGHMAFPGGHLAPCDESLRHTAERETLEEIGLDLTESGEFIGQIDAVRAGPRSGNIDLIVTPFVYELTDSRAEFSTNYEVEDVFWGSLNDMHSGVSCTRGEFTVRGEKVEYPGYGVSGEIVWGLTYRMLDSFFALLDPNWVSRDPDW